MSTLMLLLLIFGLTLLTLACVRRIPEGHVFTLRRVGGRLRAVGAGVHIVVPLFERVVHKISLFGNVVEVATQAADGDLHGRVYFQVIDPQRADAVIDGIAELLRKRVPELAAGACSEADPAARNQHLKAELNRDLCERGLLITRVQLAAG